MPLAGFSQKADSTMLVYGRVLDARTKKPISNAHVVNKSDFLGTITGGSGYFYIEMEKGDSVVISSLGYDFYFLILNEKPKDLVTIYLEEKTYLLSDIDLSSYRLTSNDPKEMKLGKPMVPKNSDIEYPNPTPATFANPVDLLYEMFSNRSKQLKKLAILKAQDQYKTKLKQGNNREILTNMTGLSKDELEEFLFFCKYSRVQISTMNDYNLLMSLMACYEEYLRIKEKEQILEEHESGQGTTSERFK